MATIAYPVDNTDTRTNAQIRQDLSNETARQNALTATFISLASKNITVDNIICNILDLLKFNNRLYTGGPPVIVGNIMNAIRKIKDPLSDDEIKLLKALFLLKNETDVNTIFTKFPSVFENKNSIECNPQLKKNLIASVNNIYNAGINAELIKALEPGTNKRRNINAIKEPLPINGGKRKRTRRQKRNKRRKTYRK
jgi:hypothetical protein